MSVEPSTLQMEAGETKTIKVKYDLGGDTRSSQFKCTAKADGNVTIGNITEDAASSTFTVPVTAQRMIGTANVTLRVDNGGNYKESTVEVMVDSKTQPNIHPSLAEVEAYEQFEDAIPVNGPLQLDGWNADVVAEKKPAASSTTMALDDQGWVLNIIKMSDGSVKKVLVRK